MKGNIRAHSEPTNPDPSHGPLRSPTLLLSAPFGGALGFHLCAWGSFPATNFKYAQADGPARQNLNPRPQGRRHLRR